MGQVQHAPHGPGWVLDSQAAAQCADVAAAAQDKPDAGGIHESDAGEVQRQKFGKAVIDLGVDFLAQRLGSVVVNLAAEVGGEGTAAGDEGNFGPRFVLLFVSKVAV